MFSCEFREISKNTFFLQNISGGDADKVKVEFFICNKRKIVVKPTMYQNSAVSNALLSRRKDITSDHKY